MEHSSRPDIEELRRLLTKYDYTDEHASYYKYGTAGFRYFAKELPPIMVRLGVAVSLLQHHPVVGAMITASHNTAEYNGVKLAGTDGGMMDAAGEELVVAIVNERKIEQILQRVIAAKDNTAWSGPRMVHIGRDTRDHSPALSCLFHKALTASAGGGTIELVDHGVATTPQLHWAVQHAAAVAGYTRLPMVPSTGVVGDYYQQLVQSYKTLLATSSFQPLAHRTLTVDCACGVGYPHLAALIERLETSDRELPTRFVARNSPETGPFLNEKCGSEFVQKEQQAPRWYDGDTTSDLPYCAAFDGDADRIVFFSATPNFVLLDGDKIACLVGNFLRQQLDAARLTAKLSLGVVQTAYANGASTTYLQQNNVDTTLAKTGVKYVHAAAHEKYDVGVYFEANGHGTVLFGDAFYAAIQHCMPQTIEQRQAVLRLQLLAQLINQAVGDALSDVLLVDAILHLTGSSVTDWQSLYKELPSQQSKVAVPDRHVIVTNATETRVVQPSGLQEAIDGAVTQYLSGRAFVRPSGTEDVVRVYAEAAEGVEGLASAVQDAVQRFCARSKI